VYNKVSQIVLKKGRLVLSSVPSALCGKEFQKIFHINHFYQHHDIFLETRPDHTLAHSTDRKYSKSYCHMYGV
jgi:hypothetical protein